MLSSTFLRSIRDRLQDLSAPLDVKCLAALVLLIFGCAACRTMNDIGPLPECPQPNMSMVREAHVLRDAPSIEEYLGRIELYCLGIKAMND